MNSRQLERDLYLASREMGDWRAGRRGSKALGRRLVRRQVTRRVAGPLTARLVRMLLP